MDGDFAYLFGGLCLWYGAFMHLRAVRYKDAYETLSLREKHIQSEYDRLAAQHYGRRERDRSLASK